jgi:hypothetical protein
MSLFMQYSEHRDFGLERVNKYGVGTATILGCFIPILHHWLEEWVFHRALSIKWLLVQTNANTVLGKIIGWFQANSLTLNFSKTYYMYFKTKTRLIDNSLIKYMNKQINSTYYTDFLGVTLDSTLSWQGHIKKVITKLNSACFVIRSLKLFLTIED